MRAAPWFRNTIIEGLQWLATLNLRGAPQPDVLPATAEAWVQTLWGMPLLWDEERDGWRISAAFKEVAGTAEFWPAPVVVYKAMPPVRERKSLPPPKTPPAPDRKAALRAVYHRLALKLTSSPGPQLKMTRSGADIEGDDDVRG